MSEMGQNENPPFLGLCQLPPAADVPPQLLTAALCQFATFRNAVKQKTIKIILGARASGSRKAANSAHPIGQGGAVVGRQF
jgi:hypothetical protein